jgi:hypothetical protein
MAVLAEKLLVVVMKDFEASSAGRINLEIEAWLN